MDGILIINKRKDMTSRDVVNIVSKKLNTKKVGHTGTLDPLATGVLVIAVGKALKLVDDITSLNKEYIAEVKVGIKTDTLDITGNILEERKEHIEKENLINVLNSFKGQYHMTVPIYSAVKDVSQHSIPYPKRFEAAKSCPVQLESQPVLVTPAIPQHELPYVLPDIISLTFPSPSSAYVLKSSISFHIGTR